MCAYSSCSTRLHDLLLPEQSPHRLPCASRGVLSRMWGKAEAAAGRLREEAREEVTAPGEGSSSRSQVRCSCRKLRNMSWHAAVLVGMLKYSYFTFSTGCHLGSAILAILSVEPPLLIVHRLNQCHSKWWEAGITINHLIHCIAGRQSNMSLLCQQQA